MIEIDEALKKMLEYTPVCRGYEWADIDDCAGRVSFEDVTASVNVPHFPKSAMDGYAVRSKDVLCATEENPVVLTVLGELCAGEYREFDIKPMTAVRVMTGSLVPDGYDCVIRQEDTDYGEENVKIYRPVNAYTNYCKVGEDIRCGDVVLKKDSLIKSLDLGLLASLGIGKIKVKRQLNVVIISTGTELIEIGTPLLAGKIYNSTSYILKSKVRLSGQRVLACEHCSDDVDIVADMIDKYIANADLIITTGGVSVGKKDIIPDVMRKLGARQLFKKLNIQPGTPTECNLYKGKILLNLSGNPYAALANFEIFYYKYIAHYMENKSFENQVKSAILDSEYEKVNKVRRLVRAFYEDGHVRLVDKVHASSVIANLAQCNCFIDIKEHTPLKIGDVVKVILFKE